MIFSKPKQGTVHMELNERYSWRGAISIELRAVGSSSYSKFENNPHQNWKVVPSVYQPSLSPLA